MSISCKYCGAIAGRGYELGHRIGCPKAKEEEIGLLDHSGVKHISIFDLEAALVREGWKPIMRNGIAAIAKNGWCVELRDFERVG